jgi:protein phosphatase
MRLPPSQANLDTTLHYDAPACPTPARRRGLGVTSFGRTDRGRVRPANEDQFLIALLTRALQVQQTSLSQEGVQYSGPQGYLFVVADGMGGHAGGEQASALAVDVLEKFLLDAFNWCIQLRGPDEDHLLAEFQQALNQADARMFQETRRHPELRGMGTTLTLAYFREDELFVAHAGDSRCYLLRNGLLYRLTHDHTVVAEMVQQGLLQPDEAARHTYRHLITNVVGGSDPGVKVELHKLAVSAGDRLLLCSDGLTEMVGDQELLAILHAEADPAAACDHLVRRANEQGGKDNITVVVAHYEG